MRVLGCAVFLLSACQSGPLVADGGAFWRAKLGSAAPEQILMRRVPGLEHLTRWGCGDLRVRGAVHGLAFGEVTYCALDGAVGSVSVHLEGGDATVQELARFCSGIGAELEEWALRGMKLAECEVESTTEVLSGSYVESSVGAAVLTLSREHRGVLEQFYEYSRAELVRGVRDSEIRR